MTNTKKTSTKAPSKKTGTKIEKVIALLKRKNGVSLEEMIKATNWLPHTTHAALSGLRKKGHAIKRTKTVGVSRYSIEKAAA